MKARLIAAWVPGLFFLLGVLGILSLHSMVQKSESERIQLETQITAEQIRLRLEAWIDARVAVVQHLGNKQFIDQADIEKLFAEQAQHLLDLYPGIQAINYIDDYWVIRIITPVETNLPALNQDLRNHPNASVPASLTQAMETGRIASTTVIDLLQGGKGIATYQTLLDKNDLALGYINGVFKITMMLDTCLAEDNLRERFRFRFVEGNGALAYLHPDADTGEEWEYAFDLPVRIADRHWILRLAPTSRYILASRNQADEIMAATGLLLVVLLALLLRALLLRQAALRKSQAKYRLLVENQNDLVVQFDRDGRFLYVSPSYCQIFDKTEQELLGRDILPQVHEDDREAAARSLALMEPPHRSYNELRVMTSDGWRWLAWSNRAVLNSAGKMEAVTAVGRDITARRKLEEQLIQSQKMQAIGLLAGGIAHDFNNLLHSMLNNLEFVSQEFQPEGQVGQDLEQVRRGVDKAMGLTRQLLAFSRQQVLKPASLDLNDVIDDMLQMMRRMIDVSITIDFAPAAERVRIHADRGQVEQIFMNLCVNSQDAISGTGTISIGTEAREIDAAFCEHHPEAKPGKYGVLTVEDTGQGMAPEVLERIFEPFFTTKEVGQGTGLGLASIYGIVRQHDGLMLVESEPGHGTKFSVYLPRSEMEVTRPAVKAPGKPAAGGDETILVAEDNEDVRNLAVRVLKKGGYRVLVATDGEEAVEVFKKHADEVDLVMLDLVMPRLGGREAGEQIRQVKDKIRILFASGYDPTSVGREIQELDGADLLMKPFGIPELLGKVREILDQP